MRDLGPCELVFESRPLGTTALVPTSVQLNGQRLVLPRGSKIEVEAGAGTGATTVRLSLFPTRLEFRPHQEEGAGDG